MWLRVLGKTSEWNGSQITEQALSGRWDVVSTVIYDATERCRACEVCCCCRCRCRCWCWTVPVMANWLIGLHYLSEKKVHGFEFIDAARICVRPSVCPFDRQQQRRPAGLLLSSLLAGDVDHLLRTRCGRRAAGANAQQQMRVASCWEPTEEAQHRLVSNTFVKKYQIGSHVWSQMN